MINKYNCFYEHNYNFYFILQIIFNALNSGTFFLYRTGTYFHHFVLEVRQSANKVRKQIPNVGELICLKEISGKQIIQKRISE